MFFEVATRHAEQDTQQDMSGGAERYIAECNRLETLTACIARMTPFLDGEDAETARGWSARLGALSPRIAFVGAEDTGKTSLVNALIGAPGLLPAGPRARTRAVTALHLNHALRRRNRAEFHFFDAEEWQDSAETCAALVEAMALEPADAAARPQMDRWRAERADTEQALGSNLEMLLGSRHAYPEPTAPTVAQYVAAYTGDAPEIPHDAPLRHGRFAGLTRNADLHVDVEAIRLPLTLVDTPSVDELWLVECTETQKALKAADLVVLVIDATDPLSALDAGMVRMLTTQSPGKLVLFVNRIDRLEAAERDTARLERLIRQRLRAEMDRGWQALPMLFGSTLWADAALRDDLSILPDGSLATLRRLAMTQGQPALGLPAEDPAAPDHWDPASLAWQFCGVDALHAFLDDRIAETIYAPLTAGIAEEAGRIVARAVAVSAGP